MIQKQNLFSRIADISTIALCAATGRNRNVDESPDSRAGAVQADNTKPTAITAYTTI